MKDRIVIIGNGISGVTAARHIRKNSSCPITIISKESKYFFSRTALMYIYMGHMRMKDTQPYENDFWEKNNIDLIFDEVGEIDFKKKELLLKNQAPLSYQKLVLALGSKSNIFPWPGIESIGVQGLYSKQDLEELESRSNKIKSAVIIGGGLIGIELAEMLISRGKKVHFLVRESRFWNGVLPNADADFVGDHLKKHHGLQMHYSSEMDEVLADDNGEVKAIKTKAGDVIECELVGLTVGVRPNVDFLKESELDIDRGILVNEYLETNQQDVYAIGDCAQHKKPSVNRRPLEQVWYTGRMMGEVVAQTLTGKKSAYTPGIWFNSAKFFDLEYQTYGWVFPELQEGEQNFIWKDEKTEKLLHFVFDSNGLALKGINNFGCRLRHEVFDKWINDKTTIETVLANFSSAMFDPEFSRQFEGRLIQAYNQQFNKNIQLKPKKWWQTLIKA